MTSNKIRRTNYIWNSCRKFKRIKMIL